MKTAAQWVSENSQSGAFDIVHDSEHAERLVREIQAEAMRQSAKCIAEIYPPVVEDVSGETLGDVANMVKDMAEDVLAGRVVDEKPISLSGHFTRSHA